MARAMIMITMQKMGFQGKTIFPMVTRESYYHPVERGFERDLLKRIQYFNTLRIKRKGET